MKELSVVTFCGLVMTPFPAVMKTVLPPCRTSDICNEKMVTIAPMVIRSHLLANPVSSRIEQGNLLLPYHAIHVRFTGVETIVYTAEISL